MKDRTIVMRIIIIGLIENPIPFLVDVSLTPYQGFTT